MAPACAIVGPSGSGKTEIALRLSGLAEGNIPFPLLLRNLEAPGSAAFVPTDPYAIFSGIKATVRGELELSLQLSDMPAGHADALDGIARSLDLASLLDRNPFTLSGGEAVRAAIAAATIHNPPRLVLDEVYNGLGHDSRILVRKHIRGLRSRGCEVVETFNATPEWIDDYDEVFRTDAVRSREIADLSSRDMAGSEPRPSAAGPQRGSSALEMEGLAYGYPGKGRFRLGPVSLALRKGESVGIVGENGAGKSTLLKGVAQLLDATFDRAALAGQVVAGPKPTKEQRRIWPRSISYLFQNPDDQLYRPTVLDELLETARWLNVAAREARCEIVSDLLHLRTYWRENPLDLPRPFRRLTTAGSVLIAAPPIILLDEPTSGLDPDQLRWLGKALAAYLASGGAILMVSHDADFVRRHSSRLIELDGGRIVNSSECVEGGAGKARNA